jgi:phosphoenolpyruvate synthase/pyruvate phosphate dikinase
MDPVLNIEPIILRDESLAQIRDGLDKVSEHNGRPLIEPLVAMCQHSSAFVEKLVDAKFAGIIIRKFEPQLKGGEKAQMPTALLELVKTIFKSMAASAKNLKSKKMREIMEGFTHSPVTRQSSFAKEILTFFK